MKLAVIGFGLMGSSVARAARRAWAANIDILAVDPNADVRAKAEHLGLCNSAFSDISALPEDCDWIVLAAPVSANLSLINAAINKAGDKGCITDLGSTKAEIVNQLETHHKGFKRFIPAHPMAGRESSGPENGHQDLFDDKLFILTPPKTSAAIHINAAKAFYEKLGARTLLMQDASEHDRLMGYVSHLPHLLAFAFVNLAASGNNGAHDYQDLTGAGYRDFTRIAASDPTMWQDIFLMNKENMLEQIEAFSDMLDMYRQAIISGDKSKLTQLISAARDERKQLENIIRKTDK